MKKRENNCKVITFANFKGGVGKTTSTASVGDCLARMGYKVLLIDLDGQTNLTSIFVKDEDIIEESVYDSLASESPLPVIQIKENLSIVPSSIEMAMAEITLSGKMSREHILSRLLTPVRDAYDYILIDCPPSLGIVTTNAVVAADLVLVPMLSELLPLKGMDMLDSFVSQLGKVVKPSIAINGVFITRFNNRKLNKAVEGAVRTRYANVTFDTVIRENITVSESAGGGGVFDYDPHSRGAEDYRKLTEEIIRRYA